MSHPTARSTSASVLAPVLTIMGPPVAAISSSSGLLMMSGLAVLYASHPRLRASPTNSTLNTVTIACSRSSWITPTTGVICSTLSSSRRSIPIGSVSPALSWYAASFADLLKSRSVLKSWSFTASAPASRAIRASVNARSTEPSWFTPISAMT
ncbi:MAG: hypothetical protein IID31_04360 [Planctomycetes bacterium]|nr:hypothetical protein [Planctomycetota bacterium]